MAGPAPACSPQVAVVRAVTEAAVAQGVTVLLTGLGGDSVVSHGAAYLTELAGSGHPARFLAQARAVGRRHRKPVARLAWTYGLRPFVPDAVVRTRRRLRGHDLGIGGVTAPVRPEVIRELRLEELAAEPGLPRSMPRTARLDHLAGITGGFLPYALETYFHTDVVVGVERRHPFLDRRLAELCLSLPGDQKLRDGWTRSIMRRALVGILPDVVRERPGKADLTGPFLRGFLGPTVPPSMSSSPARARSRSGWTRSGSPSCGIGAWPSGEPTTASPCGGSRSCPAGWRTTGSPRSGLLVELRPVFGIVLDEMVEDAAVDAVDEHQAPALGRLLVGVEEDPPRRAAAQAPPPELG